MRGVGLTPEDLAWEQQLAVLHLLEKTLWTARMALISAHAELRDASPPDPGDHSAVIASTLLPLLECVRCLLPAYRHALDVRLDEHHADREF